VKRDKPTNLPASIRQRLLDRAKKRGEDYNYTLSQYAIERFLYRLGQSQRRDRFVLKGASLFCLWSQEPHRATWDLDLLGRGPGGVPDVEQAMRDICATEVEEDGLVFDVSSLHGEPIRVDQEYEGVRVRLEVRLGDARIPMQIDVGFGDAVTPPPRLQDYPVALNQPAPKVLAYSRETVIAEKLEALVSLGLSNGRMKDFYDLHFLATHFPFSGALLADAVRHTFDRRKTAIPDAIPVGLSDEFAAVPERSKQWSAFVRRGRLGTKVELLPLLSVLRAFLLPVLDSARKGESLKADWLPGGPWR
jgi:predicted nucleotidyltransferase component of viral defense system